MFSKELVPNLKNINNGNNYLQSTIMASLELDGETLGKKHQHYNKMLKEAIQNPDIKFTTNFKDNGDINTLLQIDVACINRNVDFVLEVLKCEDMLYISRAVKQSTWLITDPAYVHIMNIDYLKTHLFPYMLTEAINKLLLSIRLHIKDEEQAEAFFNYQGKNNLNMALKWLPHCSLPFIEHAVIKYKESISKKLLRRLCERSYDVLVKYVEDKNFVYAGTLQGTLFLIKIDPVKYLDIVDQLNYHQIPMIGPKHTRVLLEVCPQKTLDTFGKLGIRIDYPTIAKYIKKVDIKEFLIRHGSNHLVKFLKFDHVKHFLKYMPIEGRYEFIKKMIINKELLPDLPNAYPYSKSFHINVYDWYIFAPFAEVFHDMKKLIRTESSPNERNLMMTALLSCAGKNVDDIYMLLQYYYKNHINEPFHFKIQFMEKVLNNIELIKHSEIWLIIDRLYHSMEVYIESTNNVQNCIEIIIIYNAIHDKPNPKIIEDKFVFNTMKQYKNKLQLDEGEKVFKYLYNYMKDKINKQAMSNEEFFNEMVNTMKIFLDLINDWKKNFNDFPMILTKIKELLVIKQEQTWEVKFTSIYNVNKSWRKYMFEESIAMWPSESVCINALKHDPSLLLRHNTKIQKMCCNDTHGLKTLLKKLRIYWPTSLVNEWTKFYFQQFDDPNKHEAVIKALMTILRQDQLYNLINKYAPDDTKINWGAVDELSLSIRKYLAKNMYLARPLLPWELVLMYAKGDYMQYTVPSLNSILENISSSQSGPVIRKLLKGPITLQKYGIRLAFTKIEVAELKTLFSQAWKTTTNATIRCVLFENTYHALCHNVNSAIVAELWELLSHFIDNLTNKENKKIYKLLGEVKNVPISCRPKFYMKSVTFLKSMPPDNYIESIINNLIKIMPYLMEHLDIDFIANVILKDIDKTFVISIYPFLDIISTHALYCNDEVTQTQRFEKILGPLLDRHLPAWDKKNDNTKYLRFNIKHLLKYLTSNLTEVFLDGNKIIPVKMFTNIQHKLEKSLTVKHNYTFITNWKLVTAFTNVVKIHRPHLKHVCINKPEEIDSFTSFHRKILVKSKKDELITAIIPSFAKVCTDNLQKEIDKYFPSVYLLYGQAMFDLLKDFDAYFHHFLLFKHMLTIDKSTENYLMINNYTSVHAGADRKALLAEIGTLMEIHPSPEVQMHSKNKFVL